MREEHGERRIGAHRADRIVAELRHRLQEELDVLLRVAEGLLAIEQRRQVVRRDRLLFREIEVFELELGLAQPLVIGLGVGEGALDLLVPR
ncbi:MAG: hypothetical protein WDN03_05300 [Rhizomicrobium sp.]